LLPCDDFCKIFGMGGEFMSEQQTRPHCGAEMAYDDPHYTRFKCGSVVWRDGTTGRRDYACYITEIESLKKSLIDTKRAVQSWAHYPEVK